MLKLGMKLKEQGAEVIALACTGLATIGIAKDLEKETGLPVIDPVMAEGMFAYFEYLEKNNIAQTYNNRPYAARKVIKICY